MKKYAQIAVAASMFALAACSERKPPSRYLLQVESWDKRWYTITIHTDIAAAEKDLATRTGPHMAGVNWRIEPVED